MTASDAQTVAEMVTRAGREDFERWAEQVARCGHCSRPVRLRGRIAADRRETYSTDAEPDGVLLVRCRNRRASVCPSCSYEYAGDMWQLLYAGAAGGRKGVPESVRTHPLVFVTLTAPGFGPVHTTRADRHGGRRRCRPWGEGKLCPHRRPAWCQAVHGEDDDRLGTPMCADCYDYAGHVAFNWWAPELWRRFTITLRRTLARRLGLSVGELARRARVCFVKVAGFQRRGVVHFHALIRLDGPDDFTPPALPVTADELAAAIRDAVRLVRLVVELSGGGALAGPAQVEDSHRPEAQGLRKTQTEMDAPSGAAVDRVPDRQSEVAERQQDVDPPQTKDEWDALRLGHDRPLPRRLGHRNLLRFGEQVDVQVRDCKNNGVTPIKEEAPDDWCDARAACCGRGPTRRRRPGWGG